MALRIPLDSLQKLFDQYDPKRTGFISFARLGAMLKQIFEEHEQLGLLRCARAARFPTCGPLVFALLVGSALTLAQKFPTKTFGS